MKNILKKRTVGLMLKRNLVLLVILFSTSNIWTQSLNTLPTDSRPITYEKLGEFAKYLEYKQQAEPILLNYEREMQYADSLIDVMREKNAVANDIIKDLKSSNESKDLRLTNGNEILKIKTEQFDYQLKIEKKKKWNWGAFGIIIGGTIGFLTALSL